MSIFDTKPKKTKSELTSIKKARREAKEIVVEAHKKAAAIIAESELFTLEARQYANNQLMQAAKVQSELLAKNLKEEFVNHQTGLESALAEEFTAAQQEVENYKKGKTAEIDEKVRQIIKDAVADYLKNSLPVELQEDLVIKSLDYAKQKHLF